MQAVEVADQLFVGETSWHLNLSRRSQSFCNGFKMWPLSYQRCKNFGKSDKKLVPLVTFRKLELTRQAAPVVTIFIRSVIVTTILVTIILVTERLFFGER